MTAAELRERAAHIRERAQYADDGRCYREEMAQAAQLEAQARWLDEHPENCNGAGEQAGGDDGY